MKECRHQIGLVANIFCSEAIPAHCKLCDSKVIRKHQILSSFLSGILGFGGLAFLVLLFMYFEYVGLILISFVSLIFIGYLLSVYKVPLSVYSGEEQSINKQRTKKQLKGLFLVIILMIIVAFTET